jgi:hypothetical protein
MKTPLSLLPDSPTLAARLASVLNGNGPAKLRILERKRPRYMSTFPNEVVTCRTADGKVRHLFCKYGAGREHNSHGHRGGLAYEAEIYRRVLSPLKNLRPEFIGADAGAANNDTWLILEHLDRCTRLKDIRVRRKGVSQSVAMVLAARWLGHFHALQQPWVGNTSLSFLKSYDAGYYLGWVRRTFEFSRPLHRQFPWLPGLCARGKEIFEPLLSTPPTFIHGEFYINNILVRGHKVFPVDWESTAVAPGEIDLAALIEGPWREPLKRRCEREYQKCRWPNGAPGSFARTLDTARLYLQFRWLGECSDWTLREKSRWRFTELRSVAKQLKWM